MSSVWHAPPLLMFMVPPWHTPHGAVPTNPHPRTSCLNVLKLTFFQNEPRGGFMKSDESGTGRDETAASGTNRADSGTNQRRSRQRESRCAAIRLSRRSFFSAATAIGITSVTGRISARTHGDRIRVAAIGVGNRGRLLLDQLPADAELVALADCSLPRAEAYAAHKGVAIDVVQDYRRLLDRKDIDAVIVATGDFQRVLPCILACRPARISMPRSRSRSPCRRAEPS